MRPVLIAAVVLTGGVLGGTIRSANSQPPERLPELGARSDAGPPADPDVPYGVGKSKFAHRPATSCAAASCHGGGQVGKLGSEHSTWAPEADPKGVTDPHSKAYRVLFNPVSIGMAEKLNLGAAHTAPVCLKCHAVETGGDPGTRDQSLAEGVGCSACHGAADKWISEHYLPHWKTLSNHEKWKEYGFVPTKNIVARTLNCAGCHVGDAERDLNHDLYAAGHPRITFEAARMHYPEEGYRKHWTEKTPQPTFEVRLWVVGQFATLRASANLVYERATRATNTNAGKPDLPDTSDPKTPWPEFSQYSCYACHQKVGEKDLRVTAGTAPRPAGAPGWEVLANTGVEIAADACIKAYPELPSQNLRSTVTAALGATQDLRKLMESNRMPAAEKVAKAALAARTALDKLLAVLQRAEDSGSKLSPDAAADLAKSLAEKLADNALATENKELVLKDHDWDALAANYLGCAAMFHATGGPKGAWYDQLQTVRGQLEFPGTRDKDRAKRGEPRFDSPALTHDKLNGLRASFLTLRNAIKGGK